MIPAVRTSLGPMTSSASRMQPEVSALSGSRWSRNSPRKNLAMVSSPRHSMSLFRSSKGAVAGSARVRASISGSPPMQESSELDRASSSAWGPWINRRTGTPVGAGSGVGAAVGVVVRMRVGGSWALAFGLAAVVQPRLAPGSVPGYLLGLWLPRCRRRAPPGLPGLSTGAVSPPMASHLPYLRTSLVPLVERTRLLARSSTRRSNCNECFRSGSL